MTLLAEKRRLRELGLPPMNSQEERDFQLNLTDTAAVDARMAQIGSTKTTMKGAKIVNGDYKGLTPAQAQQAAMTGTMPRGLHRPGAMGRMSGSLTGDSLPQTALSVAPSVAPAPTAAPTPTTAPAGTPLSTTQSLLKVPTLGAPRPPLQTAANPTAAPSPAATRAPGLINGQPAPQFFQEAANRQGTPNSYGTIKPQAPAPAPAAPAPAGGATMMAGPPAIGALLDKMIAGAQFPVPTAAMPPPPAAPAIAAPRIAPFGGPPKMLTSTANTRPAKTLQPPQLSMSR